MVKNDNLVPQKARLNFHQGILNSMLFNLFRPMGAARVGVVIHPCNLFPEKEKN